MIALTTILAVLAQAPEQVTAAAPPAVEMAEAPADFAALPELPLIGPGKGNAMGPAFWAEMPEVFAALDAQSDVLARDDALYGLVATLAEVCQACASRGRVDFAAALRAREYLEDHLDQAVTLDDLADDGDHEQRQRYLAALGANLVLNGGWSWAFFQAKNPAVSAIWAGALAVSSTDLVRRSWRVSRVKGAVLAPYAAWTVFATALSGEIWRLNG